MGNLVKNGISYTGGSGASSYNELNDKPSINGVTLSGNKTPEALGLVTKAVNDLVNYWLKTETYSKTEVDAIVTAIKNSRFEVVATLPTSDIKTNVIYLVPKADAESGDIKDEYINLDGTTAGWERIGSTDIDLSGYVTTTALNTALANYTTTTDLTVLLAGKQDKIQYSALPIASAELEGKIFEYTGATGNGLTHGYFYECVSDGEDPATYSWVQTNVQPSGGGGSTYTAGDGIDITEDVISTEKSQEGDIDEIIDVYPQAGNLVSIVNAFNRGDIYSTDEKMIGQWTDGKPLYQRVVSCNAVITSTSWSDTGINFAEFNLDILVRFTALRSNGSSASDNMIDNSLIVRADNQCNNKILAMTGRNSGSVTIEKAIIQYTKTTDTAISIGSETEYSTDEKVVGTWLDGKPIYQRSYNLGTAITVSPTTWTATGLNISSVENLIQCQGNNVGLSCPLIGTKAGDNTLKVVTTRADSSSILYITIQYTKSTS